MSARASGSDAKDDSNSAKNRAHHDGSSTRNFTVEQKSAVIRIRRCSPTAFYDILGLEEVRTSCTEGEIKKAYRKQSLLTHPDKNGYDGADEAFKLVSKAFQILSDPDKKSRFDKFGGDPDSRTSAAASGASSFGRGSGGGEGWSRFDEQEMSAEELFRQFFGGGMGGGFPGFGPQFVFNVGGPGIRVQQFGGPGLRRRPAAGADGRTGAAESRSSLIATILPVLLLFVLPLLSSFLSGLGTPAPGPRFEFDKTPAASLTKQFTSDRYKVDYWVNPSEVRDLSRHQRRDLDHKVEVRMVTELNQGCTLERTRQQQLVEEAHGWFSIDRDKLDQARKMRLDSCERLKDMERRASR